MSWKEACGFEFQELKNNNNNDMDWIGLDWKIRTMNEVGF
jgi:hypothetical protein